MKPLAWKFLTPSQCVVLRGLLARSERLKVVGSDFMSQCFIGSILGGNAARGSRSPPPTAARPRARTRSGARVGARTRRRAASADADSQAVIVERDERREHEVEPARIDASRRIGLEDAEEVRPELRAEIEL